MIKYPQESVSVIDTHRVSESTVQEAEEDEDDEEGQE